MYKIINHSGYLYFIIFASYGLNVLQVYRVKKLLKATNAVADQRDALMEMVTQLSRILKESGFEGNDFDQVILEDIAARFNKIDEDYNA
jgi:hypothetical protein